MSVLDVDRLAAAMNDAQVTALEIRLGHDLTIPARRIAKAYAAPFAEALNEHIPEIVGHCEAELYVGCACGWRDFHGPWLEHLAIGDG